MRVDVPSLGSPPGFGGVRHFFGDSEGCPSKLAMLSPCEKFGAAWIAERAGWSVVKVKACWSQKEASSDLSFLEF